MKTLDFKLSKIINNEYKPEYFIIADAKDGDMANGIHTPGFCKTNNKFKSMKVYRDDIIKVLDSDLVDIMLTSLSTAEDLHYTGVYSKYKKITPAVRLNDGTHIWSARKHNYSNEKTINFRTAKLDRVKNVADLGLYAIDFFNDAKQDIKTIEEYAKFRDEASAHGVRHFLEVFNPKFNVGLSDEEFAFYNNDMIARTLAGVSKFEYPLFLKMVYNGPRAMEELASYDPSKIIVGILGGAASTNRETFELIKQAEKYGARVALFGRKIYFAEDSVLIIKTMRKVIEENISSEEATKYYHNELAKINKIPFKSLNEDLELIEPNLKNNILK